MITNANFATNTSDTHFKHIEFSSPNTYAFTPDALNTNAFPGFSLGTHSRFLSFSVKRAKHIRVYRPQVKWSPNTNVIPLLIHQSVQSVFLQASSLRSSKSVGLTAANTLSQSPWPSWAMNWADFFNDPAVHSTLFYLRKCTKTCSLAAAHAPSCFPTKKVLGPKKLRKTTS